MPNHHYDYFIIGQGLAGSILACELIERGKSVLVLDNKHHHSASVVAAGIINPITGHRLNITDNFNEYMPVAKAFYSRITQHLGGEILHNLQQFRLIKNQGQFEFWQKRCKESEYEGLLGLMHEEHHPFKQKAFGILEIKQSAYVDVITFLHKTAELLKSQDRLRHTRIDYDAIEYRDKEIQIGLLKANAIIFCEGYQAINNPLLKHLPFKLSKGDVLTLNIDNADNVSMLNWGQWLSPNNKQYKLGSSYDWKNLDTKPDIKTKKALLNSLENYTNYNYQLTHHQSGIRPTTTQRHPFIGKLNNLNNVYCFNGFGSKACLLTPFYAKQFTEYLLHKKPLQSNITKWL